MGINNAILYNMNDNTSAKKSPVFDFYVHFEEVKPRETLVRSDYQFRRLPAFYFTENYDLNAVDRYSVGQEFTPYVWGFTTLVELWNLGVLTTKKPGPELNLRRKLSNILKLSK